MSRKTLSAYGPVSLALWLMAGAIATAAQPAPEKEHQAKGSRDGALTAAMVKTGLFAISGGGCNSLLRLSANGFVLVDGKLPGTYDEILRLTKKLSYSEQPIRILINTDHHENHTGNNGAFLEAGTAIVAHENVQRNLTNYHPLEGKITPPTKTYDRDFTIKLGGIEVRLMHFGDAHTSGDTVVYFPDLKVVAVGDLFASSPDPDFSAGGSLVGWGPVLAQILKLDFDVVVPGTGPVIARADLEAFKTKIDTLVARAAGLVRNHVPKSRLMAQFQTDDLGWRFHFTEGGLDRFYGELSRMK